MKRLILSLVSALMLFGIGVQSAEAGCKHRKKSRHHHSHVHRSHSHRSHYSHYNRCGGSSHRVRDYDYDYGRRNSGYGCHRTRSSNYGSIQLYNGGLSLDFGRYGGW